MTTIQGDLLPGRFLDVILRLPEVGFGFELFASTWVDSWETYEQEFDRMIASFKVTR